MTEAHTVILTDCDGVLTDGTVYCDAHGGEVLRFNKRDGWLVRGAADAGIEVVVITMDPNPHPSRQRALKMGCVHIATDSPRGKAEAVRSYKAQGKRVVYIGDSPQDLPAMREADVALVPADGDLGPNARLRGSHSRVANGSIGALRLFDLDGNRLTDTDGNALEDVLLGGIGWYMEGREDPALRLNSKGGYGVLHEAIGQVMAGQWR